MSLVSYIDDQIKIIRAEVEKLEESKAKYKSDIEKAQEALESVDETLKSASLEVTKWSELLKKHEEEMEAKITAAKLHLSGLSGSDEANAFVDLMIAFDIDLSDEIAVNDDMAGEELDYHESTVAVET
tara:strand:- start:279 stop:662 length:384 start_codon:yes stop_codon:yes gene_type:complete